MGLGNSAYTAASHLVMIAILFLVVTRVMVLAGAPRDRNGWVFPRAIALFCVALIVERVFYLVARLLINTDINLWKAHPAPEVLAVLVALAGYWFMPAYFTALGWDRRKIVRRCACEIAGFCVLWGICAGVLH